MSLKFVEETLEYIAEAVVELFSPNHDSYPNIGVHPFDGEPSNKSRDI